MTETFEINGVTVANIKNKSNIALFGIAVLAGSNYETPDIAGIAHFAEHCYFKQTKSRNAKQINEEFAKLGVNYNAWTDNTEIFYHSTCPKENTSKVIALMMDLFFNSTYPEDEIEKERGVIIEEKKMSEDDHRSFFGTQIGDKFFQWNIGHETLGTFETINSINRNQIINYLNSKISPPNMVFICCGDIDSADLKKYIQDNMPIEHIYTNTKRIGTNDMTGGCWTDLINKPEKIKLVVEREGITQATIHMLMPYVSGLDPFYYHSNVIAEALGGGLYSLLGSRIRQEMGLCYVIGAYGHCMSYPDIRTFNIYSSVATENVMKYIEEVEKIIDNVIKNGIDKDIFDCAKTDHLSSILRSTETSAGLGCFMMNRLLKYKKGNVEDTLAKIRAVKLEECNELVKTLFSQPMSWTVMIPQGTKI